MKLPPKADGKTGERNHYSFAGHPRAIGEPVTLSRSEEQT
jgi:hypothetical protein